MKLLYSHTGCCVKMLCDKYLGMGLLCHIGLFIRNGQFSKVTLKFCNSSSNLSFSCFAS